MNASLKYSINEINRIMSCCDGFRLSTMSIIETNDSYTFTASCYAHSLEKVFILATHHNITINHYGNLFFSISIKKHPSFIKKETWLQKLCKTFFKNLI